MLVSEHGPEALAEYCKVPISFWVREQFELQDGSLVGPVAIDAPWFKDYDAEPEERPDRYAERFEVSNWRVLLAEDGDLRLGGAVLAYLSPGLNLLEGRDDLVHVIDLRVAPPIALAALEPICGKPPKGGPSTKGPMRFAWRPRTSTCRRADFTRRWVANYIPQPSARMGPMLMK